MVWVDNSIWSNIYMVRKDGNLRNEKKSDHNGNAMLYQSIYILRSKLLASFQNFWTNVQKFWNFCKTFEFVWILKVVTKPINEVYRHQLLYETFKNWFTLDLTGKKFQNHL